MRKIIPRDDGGPDRRRQRSSPAEDTQSLGGGWPRRGSGFLLYANLPDLVHVLPRNFGMETDVSVARPVCGHFKKSVARPACGHFKMELVIELGRWVLDGVAKFATSTKIGSTEPDGTIVLAACPFLRKWLFPPHCSQRCARGIRMDVETTCDV